MPRNSHQCIMQENLIQRCFYISSLEEARDFCYAGDTPITYIDPLLSFYKNSFCYMCNSSEVRVYNNTCHMTSHLDLSVQSLFAAYVNAEHLQNYMDSRQTFLTEPVDDDGCLPDFVFSPTLVCSYC